jgi:hypothetical protein
LLSSPDLGQSIVSDAAKFDDSEGVPPSESVSQVSSSCLTVLTSGSEKFHLSSGSNVVEEERRAKPNQWLWTSMPSNAKCRGFPPNFAVDFAVWDLGIVEFTPTTLRNQVYSQICLSLMHNSCNAPHALTVGQRIAWVLDNDKDN